jgi:hypothetical protein
MNYASIKALAKSRGVRVSDLIVLAPQNDPFYCGQPAQRRDAEWFAEMWRTFAFVDGVHLRRIHYRIAVNREPIVKPNGVRYANTEADWNYLSNASKYARHLELVDPAAFVDRRNPDPFLYAPEAEEVRTPGVQLELDWSIDIPDSDFELDVEAPVVDGYGYGHDCQPYRIEVWIEKTTQNDILVQL